MSFDEILSAQLPDPRDDEPEHLRQDILDELSDHLACSYRREILSGADAESASRRAFERFGNPAVIAARLWFDAMKGRIMSQRILVAACVFLAVSSLALGGLSWIQWDRMSRAQAEQLAASRAMQDTMLKQMEAMAKAVAHPRSPDWNPASFKLTEETPNGPPVAGVGVTFGKNGSSHQERISRNSDEKGIVDLDAVQPGGYQYNLTRMSKGEFRSQWWADGSVQVKPYQDLVKHIICPRTVPQQSPIRFGCIRPEALSGRGLVLHVGFRGLSRKFPDGTTWNYAGLEDGDEFTRYTQDFSGGGMGGGYSSMSPRLDFLVDLDGVKIERIRGVEPYYSSDGSIGIGRAGMRPRKAQPPKLLGHARAAFRHSDRTPISGDLTVLEGEHPLALLSILRPIQGKEEAGVDLYDVVALASFGGGMGGMNGGRPDWLPKPTSNLQERPLEFYSASTPISPSARQAGKWSWDAQKDRMNTWTISVPDELTAAVRDALEAEAKVREKKLELPKSQEDEAVKPKG